MFGVHIGRIAAVAVAISIVSTIPATSTSEAGGEMNNDASVPDLTGTWDAELVTRSIAAIPVLGEVTTTQRSHLVVEIAQRGREVRLRVQTRNIESETDSALVSTTIPRDFVESIDEEVRPGRIEHRDGGFVLVAGRHWTTQGVDLADPAGDELPTEAEDPRVFDQTGDGNPGLTVRVGGVIGGEVYVVQKGWDAWCGRIEDDRIQGRVQWESREVVLGASNRWLEHQPDSRPVDDPDLHQLRMKRRTPETPTGSLEE